MTNDDNKKIHKTRSTNWLERIMALLMREPKDRHQLLEILRSAEDRDLLSGEMLGMIERILSVAEMQVREVMVPKATMIYVQKNSKLEEMLSTVIESGHSRFPVLDPSGKDVVGIILAKDLLKYSYKTNKPFKIEDILRPAIFTPQSKRLNVLLREFRINRNHLAIVLDEYGHLAGLVTIEDVLEQIVGEIEDEYDIEENEGNIKQLDDHTCMVKASTLVEEFNKYFQTDFSDLEFDTIGGIVLQAFGHLPKRGESVKIKQLRFKVLHSDNRRLYLLEIKTTKKKKDEVEK